MPEIPSQVNIASWFIDRPSREFPERIAVLCEDREVRYSELAQLTSRAGNVFRNLGCGPGDRVLIALQDSPEFIAAFFGAAKIGAIAVPVNPGARTAEYLHYLEDADPRIVVADDTALPQLEPALAERPITTVMVPRISAPHPPAKDWRTLVPAASPELEAHPTSAGDPAFFLYTSGSTGLPKAAVHQHKNMLVTTRNFAQGVLKILPDDRLLSVPRLFFAYGLGNGMYFPLAAGASTILDPHKPELDMVAELLRRHRPTILFAVPTFLRALFKEAGNSLNLDLSSLRLIVYGGEPAPAELFSEIGQRFGVEMLEGFGSTEMLQTFLSNRPGQTRSGTCGVEVPGYKVVLTGDDDQPVPAGTMGTLRVKGESAFIRYWNRPDLTSRVKSGEWVVTGDRFYRDADGYFHFCGRTDDMVKIAGMWASPRDVEAALSGHPAVEQAIVLPADKEPGVKQLLAYVAARSDNEPRAGDLRRYLAEKLPEHMVPSAFFILPEFPLTGSGKIDRRSLLKLDEGARDTPPVAAESQIAPRTPLETQIADIWAAVLNIPRPGVFDDFVDLGGTSTLAMQCLSRIRKTFGADITLATFFSDAVTVSRVAGLVDSMCGEHSQK